VKELFEVLLEELQEAEDRQM
jgi:hypothetical protein